MTGANHSQPRGRAATIGRLTLFVVIFAVAALAVSGIYEYRRDRETLLNHLGVELGERAKLVDNSFARASESLDVVSFHAVEQYKAMSEDYPALRMEDFKPDAHGIYCLPPPEDAQLAGGNIALPAEAAGQPAALTQAGLISLLFDHLMPVYASEPVLQRSYFISHDFPIIGVFPYEPLSELNPASPDEGFPCPRHQQLHNLLGREITADTPRWLGPWQPTADSGTRVSYLIFVTDQGELAGTLESDIDPKYFQPYLSVRLLTPCEVYLVDQQGKILATGTDSGRQTSQVASLDGIYSAGQAGPVVNCLPSASRQKSINVPGYRAEIFPLQSAPYYLVAMVPSSALVAELAPRTWGFLLNLSLIALALILLYIYIQLRYIKPFSATERELEQHRENLAKKVAERTSELEGLNEEIRKSNYDLESTNEELNVANEEIIATNEELASTNQELTHAYQEISHTLSQLRENEARLQAIFNQSAIPTMILTPGMEILEANASMRDWLGYAPAEIKQLTVQRITHPDDLAQLSDEISGMANGGEGSSAAERRFTTREGADVWAQTFSVMVLDEHEQPAFIIQQCRDITAVRKSEASLRQLNTAIHQAGELITITNADGTVIYANPAFFELTGFDESEVIDTPWWSKNCVFDQPGEQTALEESIRSGITWQGEITLKTAAGGQFLTLATIAPVMDEHGEVICFVAIGRDMTQQRQLELQLQQSQKMEAIGTLAGGIAHDFNNILFAMLGNTEMALNSLPGEHPIGNNLREIQKAGYRARDLIQQILSFARRSEAKTDWLRIGDIIDEVAKLLRSSLPSTIEIEVQLSSPDLALFANPTQIHQVLMNLGTNAGQAMEARGGALLFSLDLYEHVPEERPELALPVGSYIKLGVRDTGPGIPRDVLPRIFEPFFTTKEQGKGTGMGLAVVHGVVTELGGALTVSCPETGGAEFLIFLPLAQETAQPHSVEEISLPGGDEFVLLVDDEESILTMLEEILSSLGYGVEAYQNSIKALEAFQAEPGKYQLLFTDQTMPKLTGAVLAKQCRELQPSLPVIICTGYNPQGVEQELPANSAIRFLSKPLSRTVLAQAMREVLDNTHESKPPM